MPGPRQDPMQTWLNDVHSLTAETVDIGKLRRLTGNPFTVQKHQFFGAVFFTVHLSHPYMTTGKTLALTRQTSQSVGKVMSLLFNMLSRLVIAFLPRSKRLLISWLQSPSAVILEPLQNKSVTVSIVSPSICYEGMGPNAMIFSF